MSPLEAVFIFTLALAHAATSRGGGPEWFLMPFAVALPLFWPGMIPFLKGLLP